MSATADNEQDQVKVRRDGLLTFQDSGASAGKKTVTVTVWDGRATTTGKVIVNVQPPGALRPVVNADHVTAVVGQDLVIAPLKNDVDPNGGALRLAQVEASGAGGARPGHRRRHLHLPQPHPGAGVPDLHRQQRSAKQPGPDPGGRGIRQGRRTIPSPSTTSRSCRSAAACWWTRWPTTQTRPAASWCCSPCAAGERHRVGQRDRPQRPADHRRRSAPRTRSCSATRCPTARLPPPEACPWCPSRPPPWWRPRSPSPTRSTSV